MRTFQAVAAWVRGWKVSPAEGLPAVAGAYVTLRLDGQILGRGVDMSAKPEGDPGCVARAATQALEEASRRAPIEHDALFEENLRALAPRIAITLELAGSVVPFAPREYAEAAADVAPGIEGVAIRMGDRIAAMFPEQMLLNATDPGAALSALASKLADDPAAGLKKPADLAAERGFAFYRFRTSTIGQPKAGVGGVFLQRGGRVVPQSAITEAELVAWAEALSGNLTHRVVKPEPKHFEMPGDLEPVRGAFGETTTTPAQQLLCAIALQRYSRVARSKESAASALDLARQLCKRATAVAADQEPAPDAVALSLAHACIRSGLLDTEEYTGGLMPVLWERQAFLAMFGDTGDSLDKVPANARAVAAYAIGKDGSARTVFKETAPGELPSQMPWLGWAELLTHPEGDIPAAVALREMRSLVWQHQLKAEDLVPDQHDLAGGIVFSASKQQHPLPTWQVARPLAFIATMLGDERLTDDKEVPAELTRLLSSLRFLRQLTAGEAEGHMYANPALAIGGVRASLFDQRMPPEATALTLITVCETLQSLEKIKKRQPDAGDKGVRSP
jgi:hypothetical protein